MNPQRLLKRVSAGNVANVAFRDMARLAQALGFVLKRTSGSHHIFMHPDIPELLNLQEVGGDVKPYQVRQLLKLVERYDLRLEKKT